MLAPGGKKTTATNRKGGEEVSIVGLGYVGLSTAVCFASRGLKVYGVDIDSRKVEAILHGKIPFFEDGLEPMLKSALQKHFLDCSTDYAEGLSESDFTFITVGTPSKPDGEIDLTFVKDAASKIGEFLKQKQSYHVVVVKSSVIAGTTEGVVKPLIEKSSGKTCGKDFGLCANPEFLYEGTAVRDTLSPDAIVIGAVDEHSGKSLLGLYKRFYQKMPPVIMTKPANAELIKYSVNTFRATQLSYLNTLANLCEKILGANIEDVIFGLKSITKIDNRYLKTGLGYGGSCLPKDLRALMAHCKALGVDPVLLYGVDRTNEMLPHKVVEMAKRLVGNLKGKRIAVLGLAFKPGTDDIRESRAIELVRALLSEGAQIKVYDPRAMENVRRVLADAVVYASNSLDCIRDVDCCIVATAWEEFKGMKPKEFKALMREPALVDCWGIYEASVMEPGMAYARLGRISSYRSKSLLAESSSRF